MANLVLPPTPRNTKFYKERLKVRSEDYRSLFRFNVENVDWISDHFLTGTETRGAALSTRTQMMIFLRYLADPGFQTGVGHDMGVDQTTVSKYISKVLDHVIAKVDFWIKFPETEQEITKAKEDWRKRFKLPGCIGALDCTHVIITKPSLLKHGDDYTNRKKRPSINVQATCNAMEVFTSVNASWPGSVHDSRIWKTSEECQSLSLSTDTFLIADSGYGIAPWLITPYDSPQTPAERYFNLTYAKERVIIERCFGQVKRRFPILHYKVRVKLENVSKIIISCFVLHNIAKYLSDPDSDFPTLPNRPEDDGTEIATEELSVLRTRNLGKQKRLNLTDYLYRNRRQ